MTLWRGEAGKLAVFAYDKTTGLAKTGDAANITAQRTLITDGAYGTPDATNDTNPTEHEATDHSGIYLFDITAAESECDELLVSAVSATSNILIEPVIVPTRRRHFTGGTVDDGAGAPTTTVFFSDLTTPANDTFNNMFLVFVTGTNVGLARKITDFAQSNGAFTVEAFPTAPSDGDKFIVIGKVPD